MLKRQAGKSVESQTPMNGNYLEHQHCEMVREIYQTIHASSLGNFTSSLIDTWWNDLSAVAYALDRSPEPTFKNLIEVIDGLAEGRNELRHARFLFDVEEINSVHRFVMRNRAVLRGKHILQKVLMVWPHR